MLLLYFFLAFLANIQLYLFQNGGHFSIGSSYIFSSSLLLTMRNDFLYSCYPFCYTHLKCLNTASLLGRKEVLPLVIGESPAHQDGFITLVKLGFKCAYLSQLPYHLSSLSINIYQNHGLFFFS